MIALIDYDGGNFKSIINILKRSNIKYVLTNKKKEILNCKNIILPGVSNFDYCIKKLKFLDLDQILYEANGDESNLQNYVLDKLDISQEEFKKIMSMKNKNFRDFNTYYNYFRYFKIPVKILYKLNFIPKILYLRYFG